MTTYVAVDVETTGLDPAGDAIIEIAAIAFRGDEIVEEWSSLVDPGRDIPPFITQLTGITQAMLKKAPSLQTLRSQVRRLLGERVVVGHNVAFDMGFLEAAGLGLGQHRLDTITLASILLPAAGRYSLDALSQYLQLPNPRGYQDHRALGDARRTVDLFLALYQRAAALDFHLLSEIVAAGRQLGWPETVFFDDALRQAGREAFGKPGRINQLFNPPKLEGHTLNPRDDLEQIDVQMIGRMLRPGGNFSRAFPAYEYRPQQVQMVTAVAQSFNDSQHLIVEAGTGTGKSVGYLLPAAFWATQNERRVVVSTATINLQDQLIHKDIPALTRLLPFEIRATVLKGKRNYLCTRLFQEMRHRGPANADEIALFARILVWLPTSKTGDANEISLRTNGERLAWDRLSAENEGCKRDVCTEAQCPMHIARRQAELSHILIVNHALLLADVSVENRLLPSFKELVIDEAHHLEAAITDALSFRADKRFIEALLDELAKPRAGLIADLQNQAQTQLPAPISRLIEGQINQLRGVSQQTSGRVEEFFTTLDFYLQDRLNPRSQFAEQIRLLPAGRDEPAWSQVVRAWNNLDSHFEALGDGLGRLVGGLEDILESYGLENGDDLMLALSSLARTLEETRRNLNFLITEPQTGQIYWLESFKGRISLHSAPLHVGPLVEKHIFEDKDAVILTSATLRTAGRDGYGDVSFAYLRERLHASNSGELAVGSPFDYKQNTLLYLVSDMPEPNQPGYQRYVEEAIVAVAKTLGGRTMVLFTAYGQLSATGRAIANDLAEAGITLLAQNEGGSRQQLLEQFKTTPAVLLGTKSFWEGVDVPGKALQAVIIAKLPFDVPSDPIFAARSETFGDPFFDYSIPEAVLRFRQGFGRLIRRHDDEGVVVILDKRVMTKRYGQSFLESLPECTVIRQRHGRLAELITRWFNRERN